MNNNKDVQIPQVSDLSKDELIKIIGLYLGEVLVHYGMWLTESIHAQGLNDAIKMEDDVIRKYGPTIMKRLGGHLGIEIENEIPTILLNKSKDQLLEMITDITKLWLAGDGIWFQAVEKKKDMAAAKQVNDTCWFHFAKIEAAKLKRFLDMEEFPGLKGLEKALRLRMYASINEHSIEWDSNGALIFRMIECRVQLARTRKGLDNYPCKSGGMVEYSQFAKGIDERISTECLLCPPDVISDNQYCKWRFIINQDGS